MTTFFQLLSSLKSRFSDFLDPLRYGYPSQRATVHERFFADAVDSIGNINVSELTAPKKRVWSDVRYPVRDGNCPELFTQKEREFTHLFESRRQSYGF